MRKRRIKNPGLITSSSFVIFCEAHLVLYQRKKSEVQELSLLLCYTALFSTVISLSLAIVLSDLSSIKTSFPLK